MQFKDNKTVVKQIHNQTDVISKQLFALRDLVKQVAEEIEDSGVVEETLKWSEPSYVTKYGSTIRINRYAQTNQVAVYFNCQSSLIETFREIYSDTFAFEGKRALVLKKEQAIPVDELKHCILLALTYHKVKHLPLLGA